jgi:hypothetical protein
MGLFNRVFGGRREDAEQASPSGTPILPVEDAGLGVPPGGSLGLPSVRQQHLSVHD